MPCSSSRWPRRSAASLRLVVDGRIGLERAGDDAEHRDAAGERIGDRLPHERGGRRLVVGLARRSRRRPCRAPRTADRPATAGRRRSRRAAAGTPMLSSRRGADQREQLAGDGRARAGRRPARRRSACRPRRTSPSAFRRPRRPSRSALRARLSTAAAMSAGIGAFGELAALVGLEDEAPSSTRDRRRRGSSSLRRSAAESG